MELESGDSVANQLIVYGTFEPFLGSIIQDFAKRRYSFIDVGCNVGYFSCLFSKYASPKAFILAIDAHPKMVESAKKNRDLGGFSFEVSHYAIGEKAGHVTLSWPKNGVSHASLGPFKGPVERVDVEMTTLPHLIKGKQLDKSLLKVDIEGYEIPLLRSLQELAIKPPEILFECVEENFIRCGFNRDEIFQMPSLKGYQLFGLSSKRGSPILLKKCIPSYVDTIWARREV